MYHIEIAGVLVSLYWPSALAGIAMAIGLALFRRRNDRFHTPAKRVVGTILFGLLGGLIGAKAFQVIGRVILYGDTPGFWTLETWIWMIPGVGVLYGGLFGGIAFALLYIRKHKLDFIDVTDILVPSVLLFFTFGRIGCFFAGCCHGHAADWGIDGVIPVQLFEAAFTFLFMSVLLILRPERKTPGVLLPLYLMIYAVGRFVLEFFRGDMNRGVFLLSTSQWISLLVFPAGILLLRWVKKQQREIA